MTSDLEKDVCYVHIRVTSILGNVYLGSNSMASQRLCNTVKADKVDLRFDIAESPVWNCALG